MAEHYKRFVFDLDDTISHTLNRDWENAVPDTEIISKINELYDNGFEIWIVTARGMLSCDGDIALREQTYRTQIIEWLSIHNVKYHVLSFEKVLGAYYVDDKALSINDFKKTEFKILRGLSGRDVFISGDRNVSKTCDNALQVAAWYERARDNLIAVPQVYSVIGKTLNLEYIDGHKFKPQTFVHKLVRQIYDFKHCPPMSNFDFATYIERVYEHLQVSEVSLHAQNKIMVALEDIEPLMNKQKSFCHGDFSIDNIVVTNRTWYLIDPNPTEYSSWVLDMSKLLMSLERFGYYDDKEAVIAQLQKYIYGIEDNNIVTAITRVLELTHWVRMLKYIRHNTEQHELYQRALSIIENGILHL